MSAHLRADARDAIRAGAGQPARGFSACAAAGDTAATAGHVRQGASRCGVRLAHEVKQLQRAGGSVKSTAEARGWLEHQADAAQRSR